MDRAPRRTCLGAAGVVAVVGALATVVGGCGEASVPAAGKVLVSVSIPPAAYFVNRIGGEKVDVQLMIQPYQDPHSYEPTSEQLVRLSQTQLYVEVGLPGFPIETRHIEPILRQNPGIRVVNMSQGVKRRPATADEAVALGIAKGPHEEEEAGAPDPHIWTSAANVRVIAKNICEGLAAVDGKDREYFQKNLEAFLADVDRLDGEIRKELADEKGAYFLVFHPGWGYFADEYGLHEVAIEVGGKEPSPQDMQRIVDFAREKGIKVIFVQKGFSPRAAQAIAEEIGARTADLDSMERDWMQNMRSAAEAFKGAVSKKP